MLHDAVAVSTRAIWTLYKDTSVSSSPRLCHLPLPQCNHIAGGSLKTGSAHSTAALHAKSSLPLEVVSMQAVMSVLNCPQIPRCCHLRGIACNFCQATASSISYTRGMELQWRNFGNHATVRRLAHRRKLPGKALGPPGHTRPSTEGPQESLARPWRTPAGVRVEDLTRQWPSDML